MVVSKQISFKRTLALCLPVLLLGIVAAARQAPAARAAGITIRYSAGWNLVGGPDGTVFNSSGATYTLGGGDADYVQNPGSAPIAGGKGYWAYFPTDTNVTLNGAGLPSVRVTLPPNQYVMIGDPSGTQSALVDGVFDQVLTYNASSQRYDTTTTLDIGQGAWVISSAGGTVTLTASGPAQSIPVDNGSGSGDLPTPAPAPTSSATATPVPSNGSGTTCTSGPLCQVLAVTAGIDGGRSTYMFGSGGNIVQNIDIYSFGKPFSGASLVVYVNGFANDFGVVPAHFSGVLRLNPGLAVGSSILFHVVASYNGVQATADVIYKVTQ
ncbi:MAG: hypothetical protein ACYDCQ_04430 [Dehalococcoidia bacterium]